jgi:hypothetical protein
MWPETGNLNLMRPTNYRGVQVFWLLGKQKRGAERLVLL